MLKLLKHLVTEDDGAVTVDWVVLTALVVTLLGAGFGLMKQKTAESGQEIGTYLSDRQDLLQ